VLLNAKIVEKGRCCTPALAQFSTLISVTHALLATYESQQSVRLYCVLADGHSADIACVMAMRLTWRLLEA